MEAVDNSVCIEDFKNLLSTKGLLDVNSAPWQHHSIYHGADSLNHHRCSTHREVSRSIIKEKNQGGIYAYFFGNQCLYIGVSKCLQERTHQHLLESCGVWGHHRYKNFFMLYPGKIDLYILRIGDQGREGIYLRSIIEKVLQIHYDPELKSIKI
jgi:hypothetical protein